MATGQANIAALYENAFRTPLAITIGPILRDSPYIWVCYAVDQVTGEGLRWNLADLNHIFVARMRLREGKVSEFVEHYRQASSWLPLSQDAKAQIQPVQQTTKTSHREWSEPGNSVEDWDEMMDRRQREYNERRAKQRRSKTKGRGILAEDGFLRACYELRWLVLALSLAIGCGGIAVFIHAAAHVDAAGNYHPYDFPPAGAVLCGIAAAGVLLFIASYLTMTPEEQARMNERTARRQAIIDPLARMTMYSKDPELARTSMIYTAQRELQKYHQAQAMSAQQRLEDQAREEERMKLLAREMAKEMVAEVERQRRRST